ncbi:dienelactone hydrolase-like protein [Tothia fuscella]|uniref:Dienelactone hydrolase-like protein n=1 Tax=Tothia fuscella TaxID=1048955 RepID=A0A9P4NY73_9PEZI|nr:dienelactone hydrolase-like protein [Tothia fuscella]
MTSGNNFLSQFHNTIPRLYITAETDTMAEFDQVTLKHWRSEGFDITYLPYADGGEGYVEEILGIAGTLALGEFYGIVAYGDAAAVCLETFRTIQAGKLCVLVAYYPSSIPDPFREFPVNTRVLVHLAGEEVGVTRTQELLGIQGKRKTVRKSIPEGVGISGFIKKLAYPSYAYEGVEPGFAEWDLEEFDKVASRIAWTRSLDAVRKGFRAEVDIEKVWDEHVELEFVTRDPDKTMETMVARPYVNHVPTLTGGVGKKDLRRFYADYFIPSNPPSLKMRLISRTIGTDRVVDEMILSFKHTQEMPWMLPGVPPTNKSVEVALVSVVRVRGGKLEHEHIYWDQATVLVQLGLLDPKLIPDAFKDKVKMLPVAGAESARKVADEDSEPSNDLIPDWNEEEEEEG